MQLPEMHGAEIVNGLQKGNIGLKRTKNKT